MNKPLVSVVVPAYNASEYLVKLITCMENQIYKDWELIIVDDQSTDNTISVINTYLSIDKRIKLVVRDREPKGSVTCRNIGLSLVEGTYLINIDADDLISTKFLEDRVNFMENNLDCDYSTFKACAADVRDNKVYYMGKVWGEKSSEDILSGFLKTKYPFSIWNNIYRTAIFRNEKWDENVKIYTDFSFAVTIILKGYKHKFSPKKECDYFYRIGRQNSMCSSFISKEKYESTKYLFNKTFQQISEFKNSKKYKKDFMHFFILQFSRLLADGTEEQKKDFIEFTSMYYSKAHILKMKLLKQIYGSVTNEEIDKKRNLRKLNLYTMLFYYPIRIVLWLKHKLSAKNYNVTIDLDQDTVF